jgi:hypothetical protein
MKYYWLIFLLVISNQLSANSCKKMDNINFLDKNFEFSFIGRIERKMTDFSLIKEKYLVTVVTKNTGDISGEVKIWTTNPSNCGANFEIGKDYVIFARKHNGKIMTYYDSSWKISEKSEKITNEYIEYYRVKGV